MQWDTDPTLTTRIHLDAYAASRDGVLDSLVADGTYSLCMDRPARFVLPVAKGALVMGWSEADAEEESCWKLYEMVGASSAHARDSTGSSSGFKEMVNSKHSSGYRRLTRVRPLEMMKGKPTPAGSAVGAAGRPARFYAGITASGQGEAPKGQRLRHPETIEIDEKGPLLMKTRGVKAGRWVGGKKESVVPPMPI